MNNKHFLCLMGFLLQLGCGHKPPINSQSYFAFDKDLPGLTPKVFAKKQIAPNDEYVGYGRFDPLTGDFYYSVTDENWFPNRLYRLAPGKAPELLHLVSDTWEGEPAFTPGHQLVITAIKSPADNSLWQADLYRLQRHQDTWINAVVLSDGINSDASEWNASFSNKGTLYFSSERKKGTNALHGDIHLARQLVGGRVEVEELPQGINTNYNDSDPLIAPDESFLIFHSNRPGGFGEHDLYVSFQVNGAWTAPLNLGDAINTPGWEMAPALTPDGKFLMFTWREAMETKIPSEIRWVSIELLELIKGRNR